MHGNKEVHLERHEIEDRLDDSYAWQRGVSGMKTRIPGLKYLAGVVADRSVEKWEGLLEANQARQAIPAAGEPNLVVPAQPAE